MRSLKAALVAALVAFATAAPAQEKASLRLNWYLGGSQSMFHLGVERGFFREEGIDLALNEGRGSARSVQLINTKEDSFAMADAGSLMLGASKGLKAKAVMSVVNVSSFAIVARKDSGIARLDDLKGKRLAVTAGDALTQLWPAVLGANGKDAEFARLVMMDPTAKVPAILDKQVDAILGGITDQPNLMRQRGVEPVIIPFYDLGANTIGMAIVAHPDTIAQNPKLVRGFVKATTRSYEAAIQDPRAAAQAAKRAKPDLVEDTLLAEVSDANRLTLAGLPAGRRIGYAPPEAWTQTLDLMKKYRELETAEPATSFYTNAFLVD